VSARRAAPRRGRRALFGACFLASGAALLVSITWDVSLAATGVIFLVLALATAARLRAVSSSAERGQLREAVAVGAMAGVAATAAYDLTRLALVEGLGLALWPFDTFALFGRALVGAEHSGAWVTALGTAYHVTNGLGFAIAYTIWLGNRGPVAGLLWALVLEAAMLTSYPGWLDIRSYEEFIEVSVLGHVAYGLTLGLLAQRLLRRRRLSALRSRLGGASTGEATD